MNDNDEEERIFLEQAEARQEYYDPRRYAGLGKMLKRRQGKLARDATSYVIKNQEFYQRFNVPFRKELMPIRASPKTWACDTLIYPHRTGLRSILTCVEMETGLGWAAVYPKKNHNSADAANLFRQFYADMTKDVDPYNAIGVLKLLLDRGTEFINVHTGQPNAELTAFCEEKDIEAYFVETSDYRSKSKIERFNQTLRRLLNQYTAVYQTDWLAALPDLLWAYNHRRNEGVKAVPAEITGEQLTRNRFHSLVLAQPYLRLLAKFRPGTRVRVAMRADPDKSYAELKNYNFMPKLGARWTEKLYTVHGRSGYKI